MKAATATARSAAVGLPMGAPTRPARSGLRPPPRPQLVSSGANVLRRPGAWTGEDPMGDGAFDIYQTDAGYAAVTNPVQRQILDALRGGDQQLPHLVKATGRS